MSYTRKTSNEVFKRKNKYLNHCCFGDLCKEVVVFRQRRKKSLTEVKTSYKVFETLCFVRFVNRVFETLCFVQFVKRS